MNTLLLTIGLLGGVVTLLYGAYFFLTYLTNRPDKSWEQDGEGE